MDDTQYKAWNRLLYRWQYFGSMVQSHNISAPINKVADFYGKTATGNSNHYKTGASLLPHIDMDIFCKLMICIIHVLHQINPKFDAKSKQNIWDFQDG